MRAITNGAATIRGDSFSSNGAWSKGDRELSNGCPDVSESNAKARCRCLKPPRYSGGCALPARGECNQRVILATGRWRWRHTLLCGASQSCRVITYAKSGAKGRLAGSYYYRVICHSRPAHPSLSTDELCHLRPVEPRRGKCADKVGRGMCELIDVGTTDDGISRLHAVLLWSGCEWRPI